MISDIPPPGSPVLRFSALHRWVVARINRLRQKPLFVISPELADIVVSLDRRIDELAVLALAAADVKATDDVAEMVEMERPARRVGQRHGAQRLDECVLVVGLAAGLFETGLRGHAVYVKPGG